VEFFLLADNEAFLVIGYWLLVIGYWLLVIGSKILINSCCSNYCYNNLINLLHICFVKRGRHSDKNFGGPLNITLKQLELVFNRRFKKAGLNITADQWRILILLFENDGLSQVDLCEGSSKGAPTVSRMINLLYKKKFIKRSRFGTDRRRYKIYLSEKGKTIVEQGLPLVYDMRQSGWEGLNNTDYDNLIRILKKLRENFNKME